MLSTNSAMKDKLEHLKKDKKKNNSKESKISQGNFISAM